MPDWDITNMSLLINFSKLVLKKLTHTHTYTHAHPIGPMAQKHKTWEREGAALAPAMGPHNRIGGFAVSHGPSYGAAADCGRNMVYGGGGIGSLPRWSLGHLYAHHHRAGRGLARTGTAPYGTGLFCIWGDRNRSPPATRQSLATTGSRGFLFLIIKHLPRGAGKNITGSSFQAKDGVI